MRKNKLTSKRFLKPFIIYAVALIVLLIIMIIVLKEQFYLMSQAAFEKGEYETFTYYLNLSGKRGFEIPGVIFNVPSNAFNKCKNLKFNEYKGCKYLESNGNKYYLLVSSSEPLEKYEIHTDTEMICIGAFREYPVEEFIVPSENRNFVSVNGSLYTRDMSRLVRYATGRKDIHFNVPETVKIIEPYAFYYDSHLQSVTLPNDLQKIGSFAFGYSLIESITIPNTAVIIGEGSFSNSAMKIITIQKKIKGRFN